MPGAEPRGDPRLGADQQAGEEDQPGDDGLEDPGRQPQQQRGPRHAAGQAGDDDGRGDPGVLPQLAPVAPRAAEAGRGHAHGVGGVGGDRGQAHGQQHGKAQERGDADRRGEHARAEAGREDRELLEERHPAPRAPSSATSLTSSTWACMAAAAASASPSRIAPAMARWLASEVLRAVGLGERLDAGLADQVADLVHQPGQQQGVGGGGDGTVEALVALDAAPARLDVGLHGRQGVVDARQVVVRTTARRRARRSWSRGRRGSR